MIKVGARCVPAHLLKIRVRRLKETSCYRYSLDTNTSYIILILVVAIEDSTLGVKSQLIDELSEQKTSVCQDEKHLQNKHSEQHR